MQAVSSLVRLTKEELHNYERPVTYLAWQNAEMNRDRKKQRKPYKIEQFYYYASEEFNNLPEAKYGAAALELIKRELFPSWALFVFSDLKVKAKDALPPEVLCFQCEDAIILAPSIEGAEVSGMLIINKTASEQARTMKSPCGKIIEVVMPKTEGSIQATEDAVIRLLRIVQIDPTD